MKKEIFIYGAGGLGCEVLSMVRSMPEWTVAGFVDDTIVAGKHVLGVEVKGGAQFLESLDRLAHVVLAFGDPAVKQRIASTIQNQNLVYPVLIHPRALAQDLSSINIGAGSIITAGTVLTTKITIGGHVLVNLNSTIGHDCSIGDYCSIMPGVNIAGGVWMDEGVLIGSGSNVRNKVRLGKGSTVGMGSVVIGDVKDYTTVAGVPARTISK